MTEHPPVNLLIVERSLSDIDQIVQTLRAAGYPVQELSTDQLQEVRNFIEYRPLDLIMVRLSENLPAVADVVEQVRAASQDIPVIAMVDVETALPATTGDLLRAGADNVFMLQDPDHLVTVVRRELHHLDMRRQLRSQEIRLKESEARSRLLLDNSRDAIAYIHEGAHIYANPAYLKLFGYANEEEMEGVTLMNLVMRSDRDKLKRYLRRSIKAGKTMDPIDLTGLNSREQQFPIRMECTPTWMNDEPCLQILIQNPAFREDFEKQLQEFAEHDILTGLYNRQYFTEHLNKLCQEGRPSGGVLYILLADYRQISEHLGLEAVDQLTRDLADVLREIVSKRDILAHFSDAVFTIYTPQAERKAALELGNRVCDAIREHTSHAAQRLISTTASTGICLLQSSHHSAAQILSHADRACETARQMGGNQVQVYNVPESKTKLIRQQQEEVIAQIRDAISGERLFLLFQPIVSFQGNTTERYKAYLRINDEQEKPLSLDVLAPVAESKGLMRPLDKWSIVRSLETLTERYQRNARSTTTLFIRVSNNSVQEADFCDWLDKRLKDTGLPGSVLVVEVTEECAEQFFKETKMLRERLRRLECGFALSHFGGKVNSERILTHLQPDYIKLDSALIEKLAKARDETSRLAMTGIVEKAHGMHTQIVAADIATAPQMASIWQFGVSLVQGDMVQEPSTELDFDFQQFAG